MHESNDNTQQELEEDRLPSKSQRKREMHALQALGESLLALNDNQLALIPIDDEQLLLAIRECRAINSNSARKRHLQLIGKLMRHVDAIPIEAALASMHQQQQTSTDAFHQLEKLRQDVLTDGMPGVERVMRRWPEADRQQLRQMLLQHKRELERNKPPAASRKLFRYLKELNERYGDLD